MICSRCGTHTQVVDTRSTMYGTRRRRLCPACGFRFTTYERSDAPAITERELSDLRVALERVMVRLDARSRRRFEAEPRCTPPVTIEDEVRIEGESQEQQPLTKESLHVT